MCIEKIIIDEFESRLKSTKFPSEQAEDAQILMNFALFTAIHASPSRPTSVYAKFFFNRIEELYQVGDLQKKANIKIDFFFDRTISNPYELEKGYIEVISKPILELWCKFLPNLKTDIIDKGLNENLIFIEKEKEEAERKFNKTPLDESSINLKILPDNSQLMTNN